MRRMLWILLPFLGVPLVGLAQQPDLPDAQRVRQIQFELNACDLAARQTRKMLTEELRHAMERAEKAEQALALAKPGPGADPKPAEGTQK